MTAPKICEYCGACLDAGETCDCKESKESKAEIEAYLQTGDNIMSRQISIEDWINAQNKGWIKKQKMGGRDKWATTM